ncbi:MAG: PilZ domain-containing protein [Candidatus Aminicenantes bacterium]|nr:PilZ domain-containing protein [Candidatus Aminicenantes bacterium]
MIKKSIVETAGKAGKRFAGSSVPLKIARRKEWRFTLPLAAAVTGQLPRGGKFREEVKIRDISSTGAYFGLEANIIVGSRLNLNIILPAQVTEGKKVHLKIEGATVRVEKPRKTSKKQGVAVRFTKDYCFVRVPKRA